MIRLILIDPAGTRRLLSFEGDSVTIGRAPENDVCLNHSKVSKYHGRISLKRSTYLYIDLSSTNGTIVQHAGKAIALAGRRISRQEVIPGDILQIAPFQLKVDSEQGVLSGEAHFTVLRSLSDLEREQVHEELGQGVRERSEPFLQFVRETAEVMRDDNAFLKAVSRHAFALFPQASNLVMVLSDPGSDRLIPVIATSRRGDDSGCSISSTIVQQVLNDGSSLHFVNAPVELDAAESVVQSEIATAICCPLKATENIIGVIQLDVRGASREVFDRDDLSLLAVFAHHVSMVLDNMRLYQEQRDAFHSTVAALAAAQRRDGERGSEHVGKVRDCGLVLAQQLDLPRERQERVEICCLLHHCDPAVLDHIRFPADLAKVPEILAARNERMDGSGPRGLRGEEIPLEARIAAVADAVVTIGCGRHGNASRSMESLFRFLEGGRGRQWDGRVLDACREAVDDIVAKAFAGADWAELRKVELESGSAAASASGDSSVEETRTVDATVKAPRRDAA